MGTMRPAVIIAVMLAALLAIGGVLFVQSQPSVTDGGAVDSNVADSVPGNPDGGTSP
jgi:hypothetical protein